MTTASITDRIQEVSDTSTRRALYELFGAVRSELADFKTNSIINAATLITSTTAENVANSVFQYRIDGVDYHKVATNTALGITDTINTGAAAGVFYGGFAIQIDITKTITFKSAATDQVETSEDAAQAAARAITPTAGNIIFGYFAVGATAGADWVAGTDDLTPGSDCTSVTYWPVSGSHYLTE